MSEESEEPDAQVHLLYFHVLYFKLFSTFFSHPALSVGCAAVLQMGLGCLSFAPLLSGKQGPCPPDYLGIDTSNL